MKWRKSDSPPALDLVTTPLRPRSDCLPSCRFWSSESGPSSCGCKFGWRDMGTEFQRIKFNQTNFPQKTNPQNLKTEVSDPKWVALPMEYQPTYWFSLVNKKIGLVGPVIHAMTQFGDLFTRLSKTVGWSSKWGYHQRTWEQKLGYTWDTRNLPRVKITSDF